MEMIPLDEPRRAVSCPECKEVIVFLHPMQTVYEVQGMERPGRVVLKFEPSGHVCERGLHACPIRKPLPYIPPSKTGEWPEK